MAKSTATLDRLGSEVCDPSHLPFRCSPCSRIDPIGASEFPPETDFLDSVRLADLYNTPAPMGQPVNFTCLGIRGRYPMFGVASIHFVQELNANYFPSGLTMAG